MNTNPNQKRPSFNTNTELSTQIGIFYITTTVTTNLTIGNQYYVIKSDRIRSRTLAKCQITIDENSQIKVESYFQDTPFSGLFKFNKIHNLDDHPTDISDIFDSLQGAKDDLINRVQEAKDDLISLIQSMKV